MAKLCYPFTKEEFHAANDAWGCNCGPSALAFATQLKLSVVRCAIPNFDERRYTAPKMMQAALANIGRGYTVVRAPQYTDIASDLIALVRIQWTGPWTRPKPRRWAARYTHWIAAWMDDEPTVFDCNGGIRSLESWQEEICPLLMHSYKGCDGWRPANVWRLAPLPPKRRTPLESMIDAACGVQTQ